MNKPTFLGHARPLRVAMLHTAEPSLCMSRIRTALYDGADAFGLQTESLLPEYWNEESIKDLFAAMQGKPIYVTRYRPDKTSDAEDERLGEEILKLADWGATLCDVMGDLYCKHPDELTDDPVAVAKQEELIRKLHEKGAEVLISSHFYRFVPAERVLEVGLEQQRRGADVVKIITKADSDEKLLECIRAIMLLKANLKVPFLFLTGGTHGAFIRRVGTNLGNCMYLCVYEHDEYSTKSQPLLRKVKAIRDNMELW